MLTRHALLLGCDGRDEPLSAVKNDLERMRKYLQSTRGGAYEEFEITVIHNKPIGYIKRQLDCLRQQSLDFLFFYWSGHGAQISGTPNLILEAGTDYNLNSGNISSIAERQMFIFDTCRGLCTLEEIKRDSAVMESAVEYFTGDRDLAKNLYNEKLNNAHSGTEYYYSCSQGEESKATYQYSLYTKFLLDGTSVNYNSMQRRTVQSTLKVVTPVICQINKITEGEQTPTYCIPKTNNLFPFLVKV